MDIVIEQITELLHPTWNSYEWDMNDDYETGI